MPAFRIVATLPAYPVVVPGDHVTVDGSIRPRPDSPYGDYLLRIGAVGTLTSRSLAIEPAPDSPGRRLELLRRGAALALTRVLPEPEAGLAAGILIGLRDLVDRDLAAAFTTAGVSHVVAISGWNIAIVAAAIGAMTGRLGRRRRSVVTIVAIVLYVAFAGASASVVRAALMAGVVLLARETGRAGRAAAALAWAATILLVSDPDLIGDAGFQLSSLATAGLIAWATPLTEWIGRLGADGYPAGWPKASESRSPRRRRPCRSSSSRSVAWRCCRRWSTCSSSRSSRRRWRSASSPWPAASRSSPGRRRSSGPSSRRPAGSSCGCSSPSSTRPPAFRSRASRSSRRWTRRRPSLSVVAIAGVTWWRRSDRAGRRAASTAVEPAGRRRRPRPQVQRGRRAGPRARRARDGSRGGPPSRPSLLSLAVTGSVVIARPAGIARISILDVGQGDAILVEGSRGGRLLIDGGPDPNRLLVVLDARIPPWDRRIDAVILSHPHEDHVAGLALLLERYKVARVFEPGMRGPGPGYAAWLRDLARPGAPIRLGLAAGDHLDVDEIGLRVLWPIRGQVPAAPPDGGTGINNVSVVLLGQIGRASRPADGRRRGGHRSVAAAGRPAARRPPQGRPSRQPDGDDAGLRRRRRGRRSRSRRPVRATRTATRRSRRSTASRHRAPASCGRTATARSSSGSRRAG